MVHDSSFTARCKMECTSTSIQWMMAMIMILIDSWEELIYPIDY